MLSCAAKGKTSIICIDLAKKVLSAQKSDHMWNLVSGMGHGPLMRPVSSVSQTTIRGAWYGEKQSSHLFPGLTAEGLMRYE